jgi:lactoylglutathione lyase
VRILLIHLDAKSDAAFLEIAGMLGDRKPELVLMSLVPIGGLFEAHLTVSDLERSVAFYRDILGLELAHRIPSRHVAFFWIGAPGAAMLGLWSIHSSPIFMRLHIAFQVTLQQVEASIEALRAVGLTPLSGFGREAISEPIVLTWMPAASVYFDDPDGHSLEYICMLPDRPRPNVPIVALSEWRRLNAETLDCVTIRPEVT